MICYLEGAHQFPDHIGSTNLSIAVNKNTGNLFKDKQLIMII